MELGFEAPSTRVLNMPNQRRRDSQRRLTQVVGIGLFEGQQRLAATIRQLVYREAPQWFDLLEFANDRLFLEPSLFAWFTAENKPVPLAQVLYGLVAEQRRPRQLVVHTDAQGNANLPGLGMLECGLPNSHLQVRAEANGQFSGDFAGDRLALRLRPERQLSPHGLRVQDHIDPLLLRFFDPDEQQSADLAQLSREQPQAARFLPAIRRALDLMSGLDHELYLWISHCTQVIQLFSAQLPNSFASLSAHGIAFCNLSLQQGSSGGQDQELLVQEKDLVFFADDLAHQCGHIIFNAVTQDKADYLALDPETPLVNLGAEPYEVRSLYGAFHGLFTYYLVTRFLDRLLRSQILGRVQHHHALGRMAFYLHKWALDLDALGRPSFFTRQGWELYELFQDLHGQLLIRYAKTTAGLQLDNQPYSFSRALFLASNPPLPLSVWAGLSS